MKRYTDSIVVLSLLLVLLCATACSAIEYPVPYGSQSFTMQRGWLESTQAWYITLSTSSIKFASDFDLTLAPKLASADFFAGSAGYIFIVTNAQNFGPVFTDAPGTEFYSGLWKVVFITWKSGVTPWVITRADIVGQPGLPDDTQADFELSDATLDYPIVALGPLGGPWTPAPPGAYRIPQGKVSSNYTLTKQISLPTFEVFCTNETHKNVRKEKTLITDVSDPFLAAALGANLGPGLLFMDEANIQDFWFIEGGPYLCQKPVLEHCPDPNCYGYLNKNFEYSPIMEFERLSRSGDLPPQTVINNPVFLEHLEDIGLLNEVSDGIVINANVVQLVKKIMTP